jgi:hypothetical protein
MVGERGGRGAEAAEIIRRLLWVTGAWDKMSNPKLLSIRIH